jgi:hypothetical protein
MLIVDHMEVGRTVISVVHLDSDSVEPAYRRHGRRLPFGLIFMQELVLSVSYSVEDEQQAWPSHDFDSLEPT